MGSHDPLRSYRDAGALAVFLKPLVRHTWQCGRTKAEMVNRVSECAFTSVCALRAPQGLLYPLDRRLWFIRLGEHWSFLTEIARSARCPLHSCSQEDIGAWGMCLD